jgi:hypothetical protein
MAFPTSDPLESNRRWALLFDEHAADLVAYAESLGLDGVAAQSATGRVLTGAADLADENLNGLGGVLMLAMEREVERLRRRQMGRRVSIASALDRISGSLAASNRLRRPSVPVLPAVRR